MVTEAASALFTNLPLSFTSIITSSLGPPPTSITTSASGPRSTTLAGLTVSSSQLPSSSASLQPIQSAGVPASSSNSAGIIAGICAAVVFLVLLILIGVILCFMRRRAARRAQAPTVTSGYPITEESRPLLQNNDFGKWFRETFMDTRVITRAG
jgi:hypothetical protein